MFVETEDGTWINLGLVRHISKGGGNVFSIAFSEEHILTKEMRLGDLDEWLNQGNTTPAQPGFYKLCLYTGGGEAHYETQPIIGWQRDYSGGVDPICIDNGWCNEWAILLPSGVVMWKFNEEIFDSVDEWITSRCQRLGTKLVGRNEPTTAQAA